MQCSLNKATKKVVSGNSSLIIIEKNVQGWSQIVFLHFRFIGEKTINETLFSVQKIKCLDWDSCFLPGPNNLSKKGS